MNSFDILVYCQQCEDEAQQSIEMVGSTQMYINTRVQSQAREYTCPLCHNSVFISISPKKPEVKKWDPIKRDF